MKADFTASASARRCESIVSRRSSSYVQWSFGSYRPLSAGSWAPLLRGLRNRVERHEGAAAAARVVSWSSCAPVTLRTRRGESCVKTAARPRGTWLARRRVLPFPRRVMARDQSCASFQWRQARRCEACARARPSNDCAVRGISAASGGVAAIAGYS